ncbi:MAG: helix-turn-helix domain-containing protein [Marinifilaceae bacterium]|jgi:AraC-like DNA-binding protein|nr:helix-turn-helix domain-containing protein [Marinifilaceae bacterium]
MDFQDIVLIVSESIQVTIAFLISLILFSRKRRLALSSLFLALALFISSISDIIEIFISLKSIPGIDYEPLVPFSADILVVALVFLYVENISVIKSKLNSYLVLIPGALEFVFELFVYAKGDDWYYLNQETEIFSVIEFLRFVIIFSILMLILIKVIKHNTLINQQYSSTDRKRLNWVKLLIYITVVNIVLSYPLELVLSEFAMNFYFSILSLVGTSLIGFNALIQENAINLFFLKKAKSVENNNLESDEPIARKEYSNIAIELLEIVQYEKLYLNPELTISNLSEKLNKHSKLISTAINQHFSKNFNTLINELRVKNAIEMLKAGKHKTMKIDAIGTESGFKSKSAFYTAFKKCKNTTPLQYLKTRV